MFYILNILNTSLYCLIMQNCKIELSKSLKMFHEFVSFTWPVDMIDIVFFLSINGYLKFLVA